MLFEKVERVIAFVHYASFFRCIVYKSAHTFNGFMKIRFTHVLLCLSRGKWYPNVMAIYKAKLAHVNTGRI